MTDLPKEQMQSFSVLRVTANADCKNCRGTGILVALSVDASEANRVSFPGGHTVLRSNGITTGAPMRMSLCNCVHTRERVL